jgi:hypothetical protein
MTNSKQQTAVEWQYIELSKFLNGKSEFTHKSDILIKAKEMEKQQNLNYLKSYFEWHKSMGFVSHKPEDIIEFNETYRVNK